MTTVPANRLRWVLSSAAGAVYLWLNLVDAHGFRGFPLPYQVLPCCPSGLILWWAIPINVAAGFLVLAVVNRSPWALNHKCFCWVSCSLLVLRLNFMGFLVGYRERFGVPFAWQESGLDFGEYHRGALIANAVVAFLVLALLLHSRPRAFRGSDELNERPPNQPAD